MPVGIENQAYGVLAGGITAAATTVSLQAGQGARFGVFPAGTFKSAQLIRTDNTVEYVKITGRSGDSLVVVRAQQGSTALTFSIGDRIEMCPDKGTMAEFVQLGLIGQSLVAAGTASAMTATLVSGGDAASLLDGFQVTVRAVGANVSTAPTFNLTIGSSATGAKIITRQNGAPLLVGDISGADFRAELLYNLAADRWVLLNPEIPVTPDQLVPAGAVMHFAQNAAPAGWIKANGAAISRTAFAALFAAIGTTYGAGNGTTTFNVPDLRGEFLRGFDDGRGVDLGRAFGSAQAAAFASHSHPGSGGSTSTAGSHSHSLGGFAGGSLDNGEGSVASSLGTGTFLLSSGSAGDHSHTLTVSVAAEGGAETRPRNVALLACIKF